MHSEHRIKQQNEFIETLIIAASLNDVKAHVRECSDSVQWLSENDSLDRIDEVN